MAEQGMQAVKPLGIFVPESTQPLELFRERLAELVDCLDEETRQRVANYLRGGAIVIALMKYTTDVLGNTGSSDQVPYQNLVGLVISVVASLGFERTSTRARLSFVDAEPSKYITCGRLSVGISETHELVAFEASFT